MLRQDVWGFSDGYTVAIGDITFTKVNNRGFIDIRNRYLAFKNKAPFTNCISKINNVLISNSEDLHVVMPMYILLEYSKNYRKTTGSYGIITEMSLIILLLIPLLVIMLLLLIITQTP